MGEQEVKLGLTKIGFLDCRKSKVGYVRAG